MKEPLHAAIVGAGLMGRWHAHAIRAAGARVAAVVDTDAVAAARLARASGAVAVGDLRGCLSMPEVNVLHVCTPSDSHGALARQAIEAGRHVLVEKPLAGSLRETIEILRLAEERGVILCPVHQLPFQRGVEQVRRRREALGSLVRLAFQLCSAGGEGRSEAERRRILVEMLPHPLSVFRALRGAGTDPTAWQVLRADGDDLELALPAGETFVSISLSFRGRPTRHELTAVGTRGSAHVDFFHGFAFVERGRVSRLDKVRAPFRHGGKMLGHAGTNLVGRALRNEPAYPGLGSLVEAFNEAVLGRRGSPVDAGECEEAAALMDRLGRRPRR